MPFSLLGTLHRQFVIISFISIVFVVVVFVAVTKKNRVLLKQKRADELPSYESKLSRDTVKSTTSWRHELQIQARAAAAGKAR